MVYPRTLHGGTIDPADDHRTAMSFAVLGLGIGGIAIENAECVSKSFPGFWDALAGAGL
jgi:3-phosphoshikimate 1-carboxyvinyltransferase